jgi:hypothetical protein
MRATMTPQAAAIVARFTPDQRRAYRKLKRSAPKLGRVLVYEEHNGVSDWELSLILPVEADTPELLHGRAVLFDPRPDSAFSV